MSLSYDDLSPGDVVRLKSGGPGMVVVWSIKPSADIHSHSGGGFFLPRMMPSSGVRCRWASEHGSFAETFHPDMLERA